jgi:hypothetical protein
VATVVHICNNRADAETLKQANGNRGEVMSEPEFLVLDQSQLGNPRLLNPLPKWCYVEPVG